MEVGSFFQPLIDRFRTATLSDDDTSSSTAELVDALDDLDLAPEKVDASIQTDNPVSCDTAQPKNDEEAKPVLGTVITYIKDYNKQARLQARSTSCFLQTSISVTPTFSTANPSAIETQLMRLHSTVHPERCSRLQPRPY